MTKLMVVGGGKMGEALVGGLLENTWAEPDEIIVVEPVAERADELAKTYEGIGVVPEPYDAADTLIAVKPQHVQAVCEAVGALGVTRVLSIAAGVTTAALESWLPAGARAVRCMPNTPALVGAGMAALSAGSNASAADLSWAAEILSSVGEVIVLDEAKLDAVTGVSGSGPAYLFLMAEAMTAAAIDMGLEPATADLLTRQTLLGAAKLLHESGEDPAVLRANVTSPGGTTAAGLAVFDDADYMALMNKVITAATQRSKELGAS